MQKKSLPLSAMLFIVAVAGCSGSSPRGAATNVSAESTSKASGPAKPISGLTAFWKMYDSAYAWSRDIEPLDLSSKEVSGFKSENGDAAVWTATFGSPSLRQARTFTYSIANTADFREGLSIGNAEPWGGPTRQMIPFGTGDVSVDSNAAYKAASEDAEAWLKKNPDEPVSFILGNAARFAAPVWYVMWGSKKRGYAVFVDAASGQVVHHK
jgi:hypothetical protein